MSESFDRIDGKLDRLDGKLDRLDGKLDALDRRLGRHIEDDDRRFGGPRQIPPPPPVPSLPVAGRTKLSSLDEAEITGQNLAIVESAKTERWKVAAGVVLGVIATAGAALAGRATASPAPSIPYAVPTLTGGGK